MGVGPDAKALKRRTGRCKGGREGGVECCAEVKLGEGFDFRLRREHQPQPLRSNPTIRCQKIHLPKCLLGPHTQL